MTSKSKLSNLFKGKSVHDLPSYTSPITKHEWTKNDDKLMEAVENQNVKKVTNLLVKKNLNPTKRGPLGRSVFHVACASGNQQILDLILPRSVDVNVTTIQGNTALQWAASKGHTYTVEKLLQSSANVNQRDSNEMTALHHACAGPHLTCVKVLLQGNADPQAKEMSGKTPLVYAAHRGDVEICRCLLARGADINSQDRDHVTALMLAAKEGHSDVCEFLLSQGANRELKDGAGNTATRYAANSSVQQVLAAQARIPEPQATQERNIPTKQPEENKDQTSSQPETDQASDSSQKPSPAPRGKDVEVEKAYHHLKEEHEQLNEEYSALARENLKLRDKLQSSQQKLTELRERMSVEEEEASRKADSEEEVKGLKEELSIEKSKATRLESQEQTDTKQLPGDDTKNLLPSAQVIHWPDDNDDGLKTQDRSDAEVNQKEFIHSLQQQLLSLESENVQLKNDLTIAQTQNASSPVEVKPDGSETNHSLETNENEKLQNEVAELKKALAEQALASSSASASAQQQEEELREKNSALEGQLGVLKAEVASLQKALEQAKAEGAVSETQRLDALLEKSKDIEDVNFDEEGFVEGRDMTKEEFLQGQNQQLRTQCGLLSEELEKLRSTFDAILKAGDNLQADYDQQATEKEALQYDLELSLKEKAEMASENEFLLQDNNELHESLKQLVHELERMQDTLKAAQTENQELQHSVSMLGKPEDMAQLLVERNALQERCGDLEATVARLQHDHGILMEEVQSLTVAIQGMTKERERMAAELEQTELSSQQHETLRQDYTQLEFDFAELLKEKQGLEYQLAAQVDGEGSSTESAASLRQDYRELEKEKQELETIITGLSRLNVDLEQKVKKLQERLDQSNSLPNGEQEKLRTNSLVEGNNNNEVEPPSQLEIVSLKKQVAKLHAENEEWEKRYIETVNTYRTHLLSAVQGHMDPDVKDALYQIIELRSMEQFC